MIELNENCVEIYINSGIISFGKYIPPHKYFFVGETFSNIDEEFWPEEI
jgi:hypothetical protein